MSDAILSGLLAVAAVALALWAVFFAAGAVAEALARDADDRSFPS